MRQRIMQGWPFTPEEREQILKYCMSDVDALVRVLPRILSDIDHLGVALYHGEFAAVSAADGAPRRSDRHGNFPAAR